MGLNNIFLFVAIFAVAYGVCPSGWSSYKTNCFFLSRENETMPDAQVMCGIIARSYGKTGRLAAVPDVGTDTFLFNLIDASQYDSYWIGANDLVEEGKFVWSGTTMKATYAKWGQDQPDNRGGTEHCTAMRGKDFPFIGFNASWTDNLCTDLNNYICEITEIAGAGIVG
uniref:C-type lectin 2 n=1 Tax=Pinctada fucata TaxID=50426 RepID=C1KC82_PINFU|nr:C-type lectin 2 [Pinctada fucata]